MKKTIYLFLISIFIFTLIACGSKDKSNESIRVSIGAEPQSIDPSFLSAIDSMIYTVHVFEGLTTKDKDNNIIGGVAESWDISEDGLKMTFHLRDNAKWSDGKNVEAKEFVYSFRRLADPKTASAYSFLITPIKNASKIIEGTLPIEELGVKAIDEKTLLIEFETPTAYFLELATVPIFSPLREEFISDDWTFSPDTYIGNGPYKMVERRPDEIISLELNTNYWNKDAIVAKKIDFIMFSDVSTAYAAIKEGSILYSYKIPSNDIDLLREEGYLVITPSLGTAYYALNNTNEVLKDKRVRRALALAIDRNYIVENITKGGEKPAAAFIPFGLKDVTGDFRENGGAYIDVSKEGYKANIEEAKKLMAEAGYPNGNGFPVMEFKADPGLHVKIFEAVQQMWKENLGIDVTLTQEEWAVFLQTRYDRNITMARGGWNGDFNDPINFMTLCISYSPNNYSVYSNKAYDDMINQVMLSGDQKFRMETMHKAEEMLMKEEAIIPIYYYTEPLLVSPKLKGVYYDSLGFHRFHHCYLE